MEVFLSAFYTLIFISCIYSMKFFAIEGLSQKKLSLIFLLKITFGCALWLIYTYYYTIRTESDIYKFYDDAAFIYDALPSKPLHYFQMVTGINGDAGYLYDYYSKMTHWIKPWHGSRFHDNKSIIQFNGLVYLFSFGYFSVHTVFMCFLSLTGLVAIFKTFAPLLKEKKTELIAVIFLLPSILFWSSGVLKEGLIIFSLGLFLYHTYSLLFRSNKWTNYIGAILSGYILFHAKMYVFAACIPPLLFLIIVRFTGNRRLLLKFIGIHLFLLLIAMNLYRLNKGINIQFFLHQRHMSFVQSAIAENVGSYFEINYLKESTYSILKNAPMAINNTLFRPYIFEAKSLFVFLSSIENLGVLILTLLTIVFFKKPNKNALPLLYFCLSFVVILALLIGLVTPVFGAIIRYKLPLMPLYLTCLLLLFNKKKATKCLNYTLLD